MGQETKTELNGEDKYYVPLFRILDFENNSRAVIKNIVEDENKSEKEKAELKEKFKKDQQEIDKQKEIILKGIEGSGIEEITVIIKVLQRIYVEKKDIKPYVKKLLTSQQMRNEISYLRRQDFGKMYDLVSFINSKFPVDDYPMYTLKPASALYGAEVEKTAKSSTLLPPLSNDEILNCLEVFLEKNTEVFYDWIMAIYAYDSECIVRGYKEMFASDRQALVLNVIDKTKKNTKYQAALVEKLFQKGDFARLVNLQIKVVQYKESVKKLEDEVSTMKREAEEAEASYWERATKQKAIIDEKQASFDSLQEKIKDYDMLKERLSAFMKRYEAQVSMNERITIENDIRVHDMEVAVKETQEENQKLKSVLEEIKGQYESVKADLSLKVAELKRLSEDTERIETKAKEDILQELIGGIKEQLYYISLYHLELQENGKLESDSVEMFGDTIGNIDSALRTIGIEKFGVIDEHVVYDSSIHESMGERLGNGDRAIIQVPGWKIIGDVYVKAQVEKEN